MAKKRSLAGRIFRWIAYLVLTVVVLFGGFLGYMTLRDYKPQPIEDVEIKGTGEKETPPDTLTFITWNVGYGGLGAEQDFFFDGGKNVRPTRELNQQYMNGIAQTVHGFDTTDFILLQEVDRGSKRSYNEDQAERLSKELPGFYSGFATNYKSLFVPQPVSNPYGKCYGGIMTFSRYKPVAARRFKLAQDAAWPTGLFMLKRCYMEFRYPLKNGKDLVIINQHLSAYDDGTVKQRQMDSLKTRLLQEYKKGNYVIAGGDWNQFPPDYKPTLSGADGVVAMNVPADYPEAGWTWAYDPTTASNRKLNIPYQKGKTEEVVIDYFLLSPNVHLLEARGVDLGFKNSDHQPVYVKVTISELPSGLPISTPDSTTKIQ